VQNTVTNLHNIITPEAAVQTLVEFNIRHLRIRLLNKSDKLRHVQKAYLETKIIIYFCLQLGLSIRSKASCKLRRNSGESHLKISLETHIATTGICCVHFEVYAETHVVGLQVNFVLLLPEFKFGIIHPII